MQTENFVVQVPLAYSASVLETPVNALLAKDPRTGLHSLEFYAKCMFGGVLACGVTHAAVVTLDVAKCRTQAHSKSGKWPSGILSSIGKTWELEGFRGVTKGWAPTFWGYGAQGLFKYGLNEFFKDLYTMLIGGDKALDATWKKMTLWAAASGSAEVFADIALCPFEMTKVKMQVSLPTDLNPFPSTMMSAVREMNKSKADTKFPFGSLTPLWARQVPYTMIKFVGFYQTQEFVYQQLQAQFGKKKSDYDQATQLLITFGCGYWSGIFCAIATQPADNLVSLKGNPINKTKSWGQIAREMGTRDLFLKGIEIRVLMVGTLTGLQWWIYGTWKSFCGLGTS